MILRSLNEKSIHAIVVGASTNSLLIVSMNPSHLVSMLLFTLRELVSDWTMSTVPDDSSDNSSSKSNCILDSNSCLIHRQNATPQCGNVSHLFKSFCSWLFRKKICNMHEHSFHSNLISMNCYYVQTYLQNSLLL